jgi:hypothetical protein
MPRQYKPVKGQRFFTSDMRYDAINWNDLNQVIQKFKEQLEGWYIKPIELLLKDRHHGFTVVALTCILIDTLAQYANGLEESSGAAFQKFLTSVDGVFGTSLPMAIDFTHRNKPKKITKVRRSDLERLQVWNSA